MFLRCLAWSCRPSAGLSKLRVFRTVDDGSRFRVFLIGSNSDSWTLGNCRPITFSSLRWRADRTMSTPRLVTAWSRWLQANSHIWVTLLAIRSWRPVILEIDIFASSKGDLNIITVSGNGEFARLWIMSPSQSTSV